MTWQATAAFLACARIGAVHSAVFAGFSAESLRDRVKDCDCKVVITTEYVPLKTGIGWVLMGSEGKRGGKTIATKASTFLLFS
jgi:acetyl-CoA synthetase